MEYIVFVNPDGTPTGEIGPKLESHTANTRLHLAFSCYVFNKDGKVLVTRRADTKKVWPGVWTNSVCGHPGPKALSHISSSGSKSPSSGQNISELRRHSSNYAFSAQKDFDSQLSNFAQEERSRIEPEPFKTAILRRLREELGMTADNIRVMLPKYTYKTPPYKGIIEHEFCPVFFADTDQEPSPNPDEVAEYKWMEWDDFTKTALADTNDTWSWWCKDQLKGLRKAS
jgi:isopentenyl-diphosphate delta-isomerase